MRLLWQGAAALAFHEGLGQMIELADNQAAHNFGVIRLGVPNAGRRLGSFAASPFLLQLGIIVALCVWLPSLAFAAEWDDCGSRPTETTERACTAIINDVARSDADHTRAYVNRARAFSTEAKFDLAVWTPNSR